MNEMFSGIVQLVAVVLVVLVLWKYTKIWAADVTREVIRIYFEEKGSRSS